MSNPAAVKAAKPKLYQGVIAYFPRALEQLARISAYGVEKHKTDYPEKKFLDPSYPTEGYIDAVTRHLKDRAKEGELNSSDQDAQGGMYHLGQIAWDALAALEKVLIAEEEAAAKATIRYGMPKFGRDFNVDKHGNALPSMPVCETARVVEKPTNSDLVEERLVSREAPSFRKFTDTHLVGTYPPAYPDGCSAALIAASHELPNVAEHVMDDDGAPHYIYPRS